MPLQSIFSSPKSFTTIPAATSTSLLVRYPESAVLKAVSASPFLAPWVEMKYSRTDIPSLKLLLIGLSIMSPFGFATRPLIPANCLTCIMFPRAPDFTIISTGLNISDSSSALIAYCTWSVASFQISIIFCFLSVSVIMSSLKSFSTFSASFSYFSKIWFLFGGVFTSFIATVSPAFAPYLNPTDFIESRNILSSALLYLCMTSEIIFFISGFLTDACTYGKSLGSIELKCILPNVVWINFDPSTGSPVINSENLPFNSLCISELPAKSPTRTLIGVWSPIWALS